MKLCWLGLALTGGWRMPSIGTLGVALACVCGPLAAQPSPDTAVAALTRDLDRFAACHRDSDLDCLSALTGPELNEEIYRGRSGDLESWLSMPKPAVSSTHAMLRTRRFGPPPRPFPAGSRLYSLIPYELGEPVSAGWLQLESFLIAISDDEGASWKFIDGARVSPGRIGRVIPDLERRDLPVSQQWVIPAPPAARSTYLVTSNGGFYFDGESAAYNLALTVIRRIESAIDVAVLLDDPQNPNRPRKYQTSLFPDQGTLDIVSPIMEGFEGGKVYNVFLTGTDPSTGAVLFEHLQQLLFGAGGPITVISASR